MENYFEDSILLGYDAVSSYENGIISCTIGRSLKIHMNDFVQFVMYECQ